MSLDPGNARIPFSWLTETSAEIFEQAISKGFSLHGMGAERHGSFEWVASKAEPEFFRYVVLAITQLGGTPADELPCEIDVFIGADDNNARFIRQEVANRLMTNGSLPEELSWMAHTVGLAADQAMLIRIEDLTMPRPTPLWMR